MFLYPIIFALSAYFSMARVTTVHVVQTCHLDVGFAATAAGELSNYHQYLLQAAAIAQDFRDNPGNASQGLIFTTHSYIVSLLLDCPPGMGFTCPTSDEHDIIRKAIQNGDIALQAFPHNSETATFNPELFDAALNLTQGLASSLDVANPLVMTQRDVPGAARAIIPLLTARGVIGYSGGVNTASLPPHVPRVFRWRDPVSDAEILASVRVLSYIKSTLYILLSKYHLCLTCKTFAKTLGCSVLY